MRKTTIITILVVLLGGCQPAPTGTAITNVTVIDAINGVRENQAVIFDGDEIIADLNSNELNCTELADEATFQARKAAWDKVVADNGGAHPNCGLADTRLLHRARYSGVPASRGGGLHPNREVWVRDSRTPEDTGFKPSNKFR